MKSKTERVQLVKDRLLDMEGNNFFTGIGSTEPDQKTFDTGVAIGTLISYVFGIGLRSGRAPGMDQAFQRGVEAGNAQREMRGIPLAELEIYLPWKTFEIGNQNTSQDNAIWKYENNDLAKEICSTIHPIYDKLTDAQRMFHHRNIYQALGKDLKSPSLFLLYAAEDDKHGLPKGGTRTATKCIKDRGIPVLNITGKSIFEVMEWVLSTLEEIVK